MTEQEPKPQPKPRKVFCCQECGDPAEGEGPLCDACKGAVPQR